MTFFRFASDAAEVRALVEGQVLAKRIHAQNMGFTISECRFHSSGHRKGRERGEGLFLKKPTAFKGNVSQDFYVLFWHLRRRTSDSYYFFSVAPSILSV
jgi:hypothetical protein